MRGLRHLAAALVLAFAGAAAAADVSVLSAGAVEPGLRAVVDAWQRRTGHRATVTFNTAPQIDKRLEAGEPFDVVVAPPAVLDRFAARGILSGERATLGSVGVGVTVRQGAPVPDIASAEAVKAAILAADSVVFNRASTGQYLERLLAKWGIAAEVDRKATRYPDGASVMEHVLHGKGREIGFGAITEILLVRDKGLVFVGPLPPDIQNATTYAAAVRVPARDAATAQAFVDHLASDPAQELLRAAGIR